MFICARGYGKIAEDTKDVWEEFIDMTWVMVTLLKSYLFLYYIL